MLGSHFSSSEVSPKGSACNCVVLYVFRGGPRDQPWDSRKVTSLFCDVVHPADNGNVLHMMEELKD